MGCDLCGSGGDLYQARIEGTVMTVCASCKEHGEVIRKLPTAQELKAEAKRRQREPESAPFDEEAPHRPAPATAETLLLVKEGYGPIIKRAREQLGLKQEDLAKRLRIKESQLHKYETGGKRPDLETARLLEKALRINLVEEHVEEHGRQARSAQSGPLTIGDMIRTRKH